MENAGYHFRTGAWVGLVLSGFALAAATAVPILLNMVLNHIPGQTAGSAGGTTLSTLWIVSGSIIAASLASFAVFIVVLLVRKSDFALIVAAISASSIAGSLSSILLIGTITGKWISFPMMEETSHALGALLSCAGLNFISAISGVLQMKDISERKTGCLAMLVSIALAGMCLFALYKLLFR